MAKETTSDHVVSTAVLFYIAKSVITNLYDRSQLENTNIDNIISNEIVKQAKLKEDN